MLWLDFRGKQAINRVGAIMTADTNTPVVDLAHRVRDRMHCGLSRRCSPSGSALPGVGALGKSDNCHVASGPTSTTGIVQGPGAGRSLRQDMALLAGQMSRRHAEADRLSIAGIGRC